MKEKLKELAQVLLIILAISALIFASIAGIMYLEDYVVEHRREQEVKEMKHKKLLKQI